MIRLLPLLVLIVYAAPLWAADGPTPYPDWRDQNAWPGKGPIKVFGWMTDNRKYFWTQREKDQGKIVFVGDSLTGGWKIEEMKRMFGGLKVANRGIGGDVSRGLLFRFKEDVLDLKPSAIVICIGTNDLSSHANPADVESNIKDVLAQARQHNATIPIVLCTIPPRDVKDAPTKPGAHADLNARITKLGEGKDAPAILDLFTPMADKEGKPIPEYFQKDKIHLATPAYEKWAELIKPVFEKLGVK